MRIGFHCWEFPPTIVGGLGTYAQCITAALAASGHKLRVWAPEGGLPSGARATAPDLGDVVIAAALARREP